MIAILDNLRSIHNVASIFRTADGAGVEKIYLCGITPAPIDKWGRKVGAFSKVSLGAENSVSWEKVGDTAALAQRLQNEGVEIWALEQTDHSIELKNARPAQNFALIVGPEVEGISRLVLDEVDHIVEIPMHGEKESLNVSVAFGIATYRLFDSK